MAAVPELEMEFTESHPSPLVFIFLGYPFPFSFSLLLPVHLLLPLSFPYHLSQFQVLLSYNLSQPHSLSTSRHFDISSCHCLTLQEITGSNSQECDNFLASQWIICLGHFSCLFSNHACIKRHSALNNFILEEKVVYRQSRLHIHQDSPVQTLTSKDCGVDQSA